MKIKSIFNFFILSISPLLCASCFSSHNQSSIQIEEESLETLTQKVKNLEADNEISKRAIANLQNETESMNEQLTNYQKKLEILEKAMRSGIFDQKNQ